MEDASRRISILVAEDNDLYRRGLVSVLADRAFAVLGSASVGADAVRMTAELQPDVVLLDLVLADGDSIPRIAEMIEAHPGVKVVVLSSSSDRDSFLRSLRAGAAGFLSKDQSPVGPRARAARAAAGRGADLAAAHDAPRRRGPPRGSPARDRGARARSRPPDAAPARDPAHARERRHDGRASRPSSTSRSRPCAGTSSRSCASSACARAPTPSRASRSSRPYSVDRACARSTSAWAGTSAIRSRRCATRSPASRGCRASSSTPSPRPTRARRSA